jgi:BirA family biotin operon repressor/biotin-[acetyl-CoA-carboxylase] ligase
VRVLPYDTIDSTNAEAHRLVGQGERGPLWIVAKQQSGGKGRFGRTWISEPGNLYCTHLFTARCDARTASQIGFVASLAVLDAARTLVGNADIGLKWPNDVLLGGAKFCGILPEVVAQPSQGETLIALGIGINLAHAPAGMPYAVAALGADVDAAFDALRQSLARRLATWNDGTGFALIRDDWQAHAVGLGQTVSAAGETGVFRGLGPDGALLIDTASGRRAIHSGEVQFA